VYIGSRASDIFFRVYDKFEESGKEEYRGCVRFEVELKGRKAKELWAAVGEGKVNIHQMLSMLISLLAERGVQVPSGELEAIEPIRFKKEKTLEENTLAWLSRAVAPSVQKLASSHGWFLLFSVLFDESLNFLDKQRIMRSLALVWGS
jgi:DNA relaxase NicK